MQWTALQCKLVTNAACGMGWKEFDRRMQDSFQPEHIASIEARGASLREEAEKVGGWSWNALGTYIHHVLADAVSLAFHYRVSKSEFSRDAALRIARIAIDWPVWNAKTRNWTADLWTSGATLHVGQVLLLLREVMAPSLYEEWARIVRHRGVDPLLREWIDPAHRVHALDSMGHNWWIACVSGAAVGLFATRDVFADTDGILLDLVGPIVEFFDYPGNVLQNKHRTFGPDGDFVESLGYLDYTLDTILLVADLYQEYLKFDLAGKLPILERVADYYVSNVLLLKDGISRLNYGDMWTSYPRAVLFWLACRFKHDALFHLARMTHPIPATFLEFLFWPENLAGASFAGSPLTSIYSNSGVAILRDGYASDSTVFAIRVGEAWNHNHADAGSITLASGGREFLIDSGAADYSNPLYLNYFTTSEAHNVTLHAGEGQNKDQSLTGTKFPGGFPARLFAPGYRYLLADATGPWEGVYRRFYRHILWIGPFIVMIDDQMAFQQGTWTQLLHYRGTAKHEQGTTRIENDDATLLIHHLFPDVAEVQSRSGWISRRFQRGYEFPQEITELPYLALNFADRGLREKFVQVFELPGHNIQVEKIQGERLSGVKITLSESTWDILCNHDADGSVMHQNSHLEFQGIATDGFIATIERDLTGRVISASLHNGSYLKLGGLTLYSALIKSDVLIRYSPERVELHSFLTADLTANFQIPAEEGNEETPFHRLFLPAGAAVNEVVTLDLAERHMKQCLSATVPRDIAIPPGHSVSSQSLNRTSAVSE